MALQGEAIRAKYRSSGEGISGGLLESGSRSRNENSLNFLLLKSIRSMQVRSPGL